MFSKPSHRSVITKTALDTHRYICSAWFGPATPALSATAAKVDPHLLVPAAGAGLVFDAAGDEVWSAVAVPVRHANADGLPAILVLDEQLGWAELRLPLRANVAAPVHPTAAETSTSLLGEAQDQVRQAVPIPIRQDEVRGQALRWRKRLLTLGPKPLHGQFVFVGERSVDNADMRREAAADQH